MNKCTTTNNLQSHLCKNMVQHISKNLKIPISKSALDGHGIDSSCFSCLLNCLLAWQIVDHQPVFTYIDDPSSKAYPLMQKLRQVLVEHSLKYSVGKEESLSIFNKIPAFEEELKVQLEREVTAARKKYDNGVYTIPNRVVDCRSYPLYEFVRSELGTCMLTGEKTQSPGSDIEKVYDAISEGKHVAPLMRVLDGWTCAPGPFPVVDGNVC